MPRCAVRGKPSAWERAVPIRPPSGSSDFPCTPVARPGPLSPTPPAPVPASRRSREWPRPSRPASRPARDRPRCSATVPSLLGAAGRAGCFRNRRARRDLQDRHWSSHPGRKRTSPCPAIPAHCAVIGLRLRRITRSCRRSGCSRPMTTMASRVERGPDAVWSGIGPADTYGPQLACASCVRGGWPRGHRFLVRATAARRRGDMMPLERRIGEPPGCVTGQHFRQDGLTERVTADPIWRVTLCEASCTWGWVCGWNHHFPGLACGMHPRIWRTALTPRCRTPSAGAVSTRAAAGWSRARAAAGWHRRVPGSSSGPCSNASVPCRPCLRAVDCTPRSVAKSREPPVLTGSIPRSSCSASTCAGPVPLDCFVESDRGTGQQAQHRLLALPLRHSCRAGLLPPGASK